MFKNIKYKFFFYRIKMQTEQIYQLLQLIDSVTYSEPLENWKNTAGDNVNEILMDELEDALSNTKYKGPLEFNPIYYYFKGQDDILQQNKNLIKELPKHAKKLREFYKLTDEGEDFLGLSPLERNKQNKQSFNEWKEKENEQQGIVDEIIENLNRHPTNWRIDFTKLTNTGKELLFQPLSDFFDKHILKLPIINKYKVSFLVNGSWYHKPLTPEVLNNLMNNLKEKHLIFDIDTTPPEYFYEEGGSKLPDWSMFDVLQFSTYKKYDVINDRGGSFFKYLIKPNVPKKIVEYLNRLQIFDTLVNEKNKQRKELADNCFVYALKQTDSYDEETLNKIRLRINNRYLSQGSINQICNEFKIQIKLNYINEEAHNKKKNVFTTKNYKSKNYLGVNDPKENRIHKFNIFETHYFLEETTPFSTHYINHLSELDEDKFDREPKDANKWRKSRTFISSSNLVRTLLKNDYFVPITFGDSMILNTTFYKEVRNEIDEINLDYDPVYCTKLIEPPKYKSNEKEMNYWYADFEADVSGKIHKPYMVVLQNEAGEINKCWQGEDCAIKFLEYLEDGDVIYFHNLAYDIRMLAQYGMNKSIIKGSNVMKADINYKNKKIHFRDSYPIISAKLADFPSMFNLPKVQKELFPYKYYTLERLKSNIGVISEAGINEEKVWSKEDYELFNKNIDSIPNCRIDENHFDMYKYCEFY